MICTALLYCSMICTKYYSHVKIKKIKIGGACRTYRREKMCIQGFSG
jgi:hypothetical protein